MMNRDMDKEVIEIAKKYGKNAYADASHIKYFIVWKCKTLQNWKYLIANTATEIYFECTYDGDKKRWYIDIYKKVKNIVCEDKEIGVNDD